MGCDGFVANEKSFGMCRTCNRSLAEHLAAPSDDEEEEYDDLEDFGELPPPPPAAEAEDQSASPPVCRNFTVDRENFGICAECKQPTEMHKGENRGAVSMRISRNLTAAVQRLSKRFSLTYGKVTLATPQGVPCESFKLDMHADQYGLCNCGFDRNAHNSFEEKRELARETIKRREKGKKGVEKASPTEPCDEFRLDMENKEGYGYCKCGFPRERHQDFKSKAKFANMKSGLRKPKAFT